MEYNAWSQLISKYYFRGEDASRVMLHITMQDLVDFAKEQNVEIASGKFAADCLDEDIEKDFVRQFWLTESGNATIKDLQLQLVDLTKTGLLYHNYMAFLPIVALLIMPICENDDLELHGNDYYGHLLPFLHKHQLINTPAKSSNLLANIKLDDIWFGINLWALDNKIPFQADEVKTDNGSRQYVRSLMKQSLLSPSRLQKFCIIFDKAGLVPKTNIENDRLLSAFKNYYNYAGVSLPKFKQLTGKDFYDYLISVLREEYDRWDGTTRIKERDRSTGKIRVESGNTSYPLLLQMDYEPHRNICSFALQLYCSDVDNMDDMLFVDDNTKEQLPVIYIKNDGYANLPFRLNEEKETNIYAARQNTYSIHEEADKSLRGRHIVTDYYLLRQYKNKYIATNEFIKGEFYFALIRHDATDDFATWLTINEAELIKDDALGGFYSVYRIEHASEELPNKSNLRFKSEVRCKPVNNLEVKTAEDSGVVYLSRLLPAQFEITGVDVSKDKIYAVSVKDQHRYSTELTYDHDKNLWILKVFSNIFQIQKEFVLFHNEEQIPHGKTYKFIDFVLPTEFKEIPLDKWGEVNEPSLSKGLELPNSVIGKTLINWSMLDFQMKIANQVPIQTGQYLEKDYLLYAITSASYQTSRWIITMPWLKEIRDRLSSDFGDNESRTMTDKYSLSNALADYFRMGYVNYVYTESGLKLTANRPTLILLTPKYKRDVNPGVGDRKIVRVNCTEKNFKCLLTGGRTIALVREIEKHQQSLGYQVEYLESTDYLQPQTIYIHAASRSVFKDLAERCHLFYQDNIYANSLIEALPSIEDYIAFQSTNGKERDLFGVRSFRAIDYKKVGEIYPDKLSSKQAIANYEIDKSAFDPQSDVVTFFPGSRDEITVSIDEGQMVEIDKYWGYFIGMHKAHAKVLQYDEDSVQISMPQQFRLPLLYARALTLLNGNTPESVFGSRTYNLDVNPCTFASKPENILQKLGQ